MSLRYAAWVAVLLVLSHLCWLQLRSGSASRRSWIVATSRAAAGETTQPSGPMANEGDDGNVLLQLAGYARTNLVAERSVFFFYFQTSYILYPRRIYVAPADKVINSGQDIIHAEFNPDREWLQEHNVRYVSTFGGGQAGGKLPPWEKLPWGDGPAGVQTNKAGGD